MSRVATLVALLSLCAPSALAEEAVPAELRDVEILDRRGGDVPLDVALTDQDGKAAHLRDYLADGKPLVLVLAYYRCPMLCSLVLNGLEEGMKGVAWTAGDDYRVAVVSFDPRDTVQLAHDKRESYLADYGRRVGPRGFDFLVGDASEVKRLADAVGFRYRWDDASKQYAHAAGAFVVTPAGRVSDTLYGISFPSRDLRLALTEASQGRLGTAWDQVVLFCYHYDPSSRGYVLAAGRLMRAAGAGSVLVLSLFLGVLWRRERRRPDPPLRHAPHEA